MKKYIILLVLLVVIIRIPFFLMVIHHPLVPYTSHDSLGYNLIATNLLHNHSYSMYLSSPQIKDPVRTPGYPFFLAGIYGVFGERTIFVVAIQLLMDIIMVLLLLFFGKVLFNKKVVIIAALLYAFNLHQVLFTTQILTETLFSLFLLLGVMFFLLYISKRKNPALVLSGISIGMAILIRPIALLFPILPLCFLIYKKTRIRTIVIFLILIILFPLIWSVRNAVVFKHFFYTKIHSVNLVLYNAPSIIADINSVSRNEGKDLFLKYEKDKYALSDYDIEHFDDNPALCNKLAVDAIRIVMAHPVYYFKNQMIGLLHTVFPVNIGFAAAIMGARMGKLNLQPVYRKFLRLILSGDIREAKTLIVQERLKKIDISVWVFILVVSLYQLGIYILVGKGMQKYGFSIMTLFLFLTIAYFLIVPGEVGEARFRVPVEPMIAILASLAFVREKKNIKETTKKPLSMS